MAALYCPCGQAHKLWGEFWWAEGHYRWVFFDDVETSETYAEESRTALRAAGSWSARISGTRSGSWPTERLDALGFSAPGLPARVQQVLQRFSL